MKKPSDRSTSGAADRWSPCKQLPAEAPKSTAINLTESLIKLQDVFLLKKGREAADSLVSDEASRLSRCVGSLREDDDGTAVAKPMEPHLTMTILKI